MKVTLAANLIRVIWLQVRSLNTLSIPQGPLITTALCIRTWQVRLRFG